MVEVAILSNGQDALSEALDVVFPSFLPGSHQSFQRDFPLGASTVHISTIHVFIGDDVTLKVMWFDSKILKNIFEVLRGFFA